MPGVWRGRSLSARLLLLFLAVLLLLVVLLTVGGGVLGWRLLASKPVLDGQAPLTGLEAPVAVARDANGVPVLTGTSRADLARALGFLHGQERFFQMDTLRRAAAGELAEVVGKPALELDRRVRVHRLRARAEAAVAASTPEGKALLDAYVGGVNQGVAALGAPSFEYLLLRHSPKPWTAEDTILTVLAMYLDLQDEDGRLEKLNDLLRYRLGPEWAAFLNPPGTFLDAPLDGTRLPEAPVPTAPPTPRPAPDAASKAAFDLTDGTESGQAIGSNAWVVGGGLTNHGAAMVANDMHLGLRLPNTWYRARLIQTGPDGRPVLDITGVTLPGTPLMVAGSNGRIAWGFTNSYIDTGDSIILDPVDGSPDSYRTPDGPKTLTKVDERICAGDTCETLVVEESIWGPVVGTDAEGRKLVRRWVAHDPDAVALVPSLELEQAGSVAEAVGIAHRAALPQQNFVVGDSSGNIAWTIIGRVPARFGFDGRKPESWADGSRGWNGYLPPDAIPVVMNPPDGRIWTANARILGGAALETLGDGGYAVGARAGMIRHRLLAKEAFSALDHLRIQLDDRGLMLQPWQSMLQKELTRRAVSDVELVRFLDPVRDWGGAAVPDSIGYRLVRTFRAELLRLMYAAYSGDVKAPLPTQAEGPALRLMTERPPALVPPGFDGWDALVDAAIAALREQVAEAGGLKQFTWGARNRPGIGHPLARFVPGLAALTDPPDEPLPGDVYQPRVQGRGFGASERFVVSPGREAEGLFHMPGGQSGHPLSPYYLNGHDDWREGRPTPFLPGPPVWTLTLTPGVAPS